MSAWSVRAAWPVRNTSVVTLSPPRATGCRPGSARRHPRRSTTHHLDRLGRRTASRPRSAPGSRAASAATAANTSSGRAAWATSVATRRSAACSSAIRRDSAYSWALSRETASWPAMRLTASSRPVVNAARIRRFSSASTARSAPRLKMDGQQRAAIGVSKVRVAGEPVVTGSVGHDQEARGSAGRRERRHRRRAFPAGAAGHGAAARCGQQPVLGPASHSSRRTPVAPVIALSAWTTRACSGRMLVSQLSACDADRIPSRSTVPAVTAARRWGRCPVARRGGGRAGRWPDRVGPVQLGDFGGRTPGQVLLAGLGDQVIASVFRPRSR